MHRLKAQKSGGLHDFVSKKSNWVFFNLPNNRADHCKQILVIDAIVEPVPDEERRQKKAPGRRSEIELNP